MQSPLQPLTPLQQQVLKINDSYADEAKVTDMQFADASLTAPEVWEAAKAARRQGFTRQVNIGDKKFCWSIPNSMEALLHEADRQMAITYFETPVLHTRQSHTIKINAAIEEVVANLQLANISITKKAARELLLKKKVPANIAEQSAVNFYKTLEAIHGQPQAITTAWIQQIHAQLAREILTPKSTGRWRTNTKIDTSNFIAGLPLLPAATVLLCMQQLCDFINNDKAPYFIHPLIKAALIEFLLTHIRPFKDVNARVARLVAHQYLLNKGYRILNYISVTSVAAKLKQAYFKTFSQVNNADGDVGYFIHFQLQALRMAIRSFAESHKKTIVEKIGTSINGHAFNQRQAAVLQWIQQEPEKIITIRELRTHFGISKETARLDLNGLIQSQLLKTFRINKKAYAFVKAGNGIAAGN